MTVAVTAALEVLFVSLQKWRRVPSHFNDSTPVRQLHLLPDGLDRGGFGHRHRGHHDLRHAAVRLPILALMLSATSLPSRRNRNVVWLAAAGYIGLIGATLLQTFEGRAPVDLTPLALGVVVASALLGGIAIFALASGLFGSKPGDAAV